MSLQLAARINELVEEPRCVYLALESILPHCLNPSNTLERMDLAVQLTACEYKAASLDFPLVCNDTNMLQTCMFQLESRGQWWTSYSKNHQTVGQICIEYQPEFEAQQAAQLYRNLSHLTKDYMDDIAAAYQELRDVYQTVEIQSSILSTMSNVLKDLQLQVEALTTDITKSGEYTHNFSKGLYALKFQNEDLQFLNNQMVSSMVTTVSSLETFNELLIGQTQSVSGNLSMIEAHALEIQRIQSSTLESALNASTIVKSTAQELKLHSGTLLQGLGYLRSFVELVSKVGRFCAIALVISVFWRYLRKESSSPSTGKQEKTKNDSTAKSHLLYY